MSILILLLLLVYVSSEQCQPHHCASQCRIKYEGKRNYFNTTTQTCEPVTQCSSTQYYDYTTNSCITTEEQNNEEPKQESQDIDTMLGSSFMKTKIIVCIMGKAIIKNNLTSQCICDQGYSSKDTLDNDTHLHQCGHKDTNPSRPVNYSDPSYQAYAQQQATGNEGGFIRGVPLTYEYSIYGVLLIIILLCIRYYRNKNRRKKKGKQLDKLQRLQQQEYQNEIAQTLQPLHKEQENKMYTKDQMMEIVKEMMLDPILMKTLRRKSKVDHNAI